MSQLFLLQDILTLLSQLAVKEVRPVGTRYLPPSTLKALNPLLFVPDHLDLRHPRDEKGKWRSGARVRFSERHAERMRFIHYLAESARLVARTGALLKPIPHALRRLVHALGNLISASI